MADDTTQTPIYGPPAAPDAPPVAYGPPADPATVADSVAEATAANATTDQLTAEMAQILVNLPGIDLAKNLPSPVGAGIDDQPVKVPVKVALHFFASLASIKQALMDAKIGVAGSPTAQVSSAGDDLDRADDLLASLDDIIKPDNKAVQAAIAAKEASVTLPKGFYTAIYNYLKVLKATREAYDRVSGHWFVGATADRILGLVRDASAVSRSMFTAGLIDLVPKLPPFKLPGWVKTAAIGLTVGVVGYVGYNVFIAPRQK